MDNEEVVKLLDSVSEPKIYHENRCTQKGGFGIEGKLTRKTNQENFRIVPEISVERYDEPSLNWEIKQINDIFNLSQGDSMYSQICDEIEISIEHLSLENQLPERGAGLLPVDDESNDAFKILYSQDSSRQEDSILSSGEGNKKEEEKLDDIQEITEWLRLSSLKEGDLKNILPNTTFEHQHNPALKKSYPCMYCNFTAQLKVDLKEHLKGHEEHPFRCRECYVVYSTQTNLKRHMMSHTGELPYQCPKCESRFKTKCYMKTHMLKHTGERPFKCDQCPAAFMQRCNLNKHVNRHLNKKTRVLVNCHYCDYKSKFKVYLKRHMPLHKGKREFQCEFCDYSSDQIFYLTQHMLKHTNNKPFACSICNKSFKSINLLKRHDMIHCDERKFQCPNCCYKSKQLGYLKNHLLTHNNN